MNFQRHGHEENFAAIGVDPTAFSGLDFDTVFGLARELYVAQQRVALPQVASHELAVRLNKAYQDIADDHAEAKRGWPYKSPLGETLAGVWREVESAQSFDCTSRNNMARYLSDLASCPPESIFSGKRFDLKLFDLARASQFEIGGASKALVAESHRLDIIEESKERTPASQQRIADTRYLMSRIHQEFERNVTIQGFSMLVSGEPLSTLVGVVIIPELEKFLAGSEFEIEKHSEAGLRFKMLRLKNLDQRAFSHFAPFLSARIPALNEPEAVLLVTFRPNRDNSGGVFSVEGQLLRQKELKHE